MVSRSAISAHYQQENANTVQQIGGDEVHKVDRVLDVRQGELVWVAGTVYMEMPLKPNILDDISKHVNLPESSYCYARTDLFCSTGSPRRPLG